MDFLSGAPMMSWYQLILTLYYSIRILISISEILLFNTIFLFFIKLFLR